MAQDQKAFIASDGTLSPPENLTVDQLLASGVLKGQIDELVRERIMRGRLYPGWVANKRLDADAAAQQLLHLGRAEKTLRLLQEPVVNATLCAMKALAPEHQAALNQVALALLDAGTRRPKLVLELRAAMDAVT